MFSKIIVDLFLSTKTTIIQHSIYDYVLGDINSVYEGEICTSVLIMSQFIPTKI